MTNLVKKTLSQKCLRAIDLSVQPASEKVSEYVGLSFDTITKQHPSYNIVLIDNYILTIEIRLDKSTLVCCLQNKVCTEARLFRDYIYK